MPQKITKVNQELYLAIRLDLYTSNLVMQTLQNPLLKSWHNIPLIRCLSSPPLDWITQYKPNHPKLLHTNKTIIKLHKTYKISCHRMRCEEYTRCEASKN